MTAYVYECLGHCNTQDHAHFCRVWNERKQRESQAEPETGIERHWREAEAAAQP